MANFREYIKETLQPSFFLTFDTDEYNEDGTSTQYTDPIIIPDESNNGNHGNLYDLPISGVSGYELGIDTMVEKESDDCKAIRFGFNNPYDNKPKSYIAIPATETLIIPESKFSLSFFYRRDDHHLGNDNQREVIIRRNGLFSIDLDRGSRSSNMERIYFTIYLKDSNNEYSEVYLSFYNSYKKVGDDFFIMNVEVIGGNINLDIYRNGILISKEVQSLGVRFIDTTNISTTYIGGLPMPITGYDDRSIAPVTIDQVAFYPFTLTEIQIAGLLKRAYHYITIRSFEKPSAYILANDANDNQNTIKSTGFTVSVRGDIIKDLQGSDNINLSRSIYLNRTSSLYTTNATFIGSTSFSIDGWVKTSNDNPSVFINTFSVANNVQNQLRVEFNRSGEDRSFGVVQLRDEVDNVFIQSNPSFVICDNKWHHILVNSSENELQLYIDGVLHGEYTKKSAAPRYFTTMSLMGDLNNDFCVDGNLMLFYIRDVTMSKLEMLTRYAYQISYLVRGRGLVQGNGTVSNVRIYDYESGELITSDKTDANGNYTIYLPNERNVLINGLLIRDRSVIPVIRGVIQPISFSDQN